MEGRVKSRFETGHFNKQKEDTSETCPLRTHYDYPHFIDEETEVQVRTASECGSWDLSLGCLQGLDF